MTHARDGARRPRTTYHHGDLRSALLLAARSLLDEGDVPTFSLREAARRAGVSPSACYQHFTDKKTLLVALAEQGFDEFAEAMRLAHENTRESFAEMGIAYVKFAVERPGMFRLMFGHAVADHSRSPHLLEAIARSTWLFESSMKTSRNARTGDPVAGLHTWATMHGLATLAIDGLLPGYDAVLLAQALAKKTRAWT